MSRIAAEAGNLPPPLDPGQGSCARHHVLSYPVFADPRLFVNKCDCPTCCCAGASQLLFFLACPAKAGLYEKPGRPFMATVLQIDLIWGSCSKSRSARAARTQVVGPVLGAVFSGCSQLVAAESPRRLRGHQLPSPAPEHRRQTPWAKDILSLVHRGGGLARRRQDFRLAVTGSRHFAP
jgi:hypothetical protein